MIGIVRLRGSVRISGQVSRTFELLRLNRENHCVVLKESKSLQGMLSKIRGYATYGEVSDEVLKSLVEKRGRKVGDKRLDDKEASKMLKLLGDTKKLVEEGFNPVFRLKPPKKGLVSKKKPYPHGDLGYRGKEMSELVSRMI